MASGSVDMSRDDIWDDSALVRSWDDALDEYKVKQLPAFPSQLQRRLTHGSQKYHSIQAGKGAANDLKLEPLEAAEG
jgi:survival motor neuron SMN-like protein